MTANGLRLRIGALVVGLAAAAAVIIALLASGGASSSASTASDRSRAIQESDRLLAAITLPPGATVAVRTASELSGLGEAVAADVIQRTRTWTVPERASAVRAFLLAHRPPGTTVSGAGPTFSATQLPRGVAQAQASIVLAADGASTTTVRVTVQSRWLVGRAASELLGADVREIDISRGRPGASPSLVLHVTPPQATKIIALFDRLPTVQPGVVYHCPTAVPGLAVVTFAFRDRRGGSLLAQASEDADDPVPNTACDAMRVAVSGHVGAPLLGGAAFMREVSRIVGYRLWTPPYAA